MGPGDGADPFQRSNLLRPAQVTARVTWTLEIVSCGFGGGSGREVRGGLISRATTATRLTQGWAHERGTLDKPRISFDVYQRIVEKSAVSKTNCAVGGKFDRG
eukprot:gene30933-35989_t